MYSHSWRRFFRSNLHQSSVRDSRNLLIRAGAAGASTLAARARRVFWSMGTPPAPPREAGGRGAMRSGGVRERDGPSTGPAPDESLRHAAPLVTCAARMSTTLSAGGLTRRSTYV